MIFFSPSKVTDQSPPMRKSVFPFFILFLQQSLFGNKKEKRLSHTLVAAKRGRGCAKLGALPGHSFYCQGWKWQGGTAQWRDAHFLRPSSSGHIWAHKSYLKCRGISFLGGAPVFGGAVIGRLTYFDCVLGRKINDWLCSGRTKLESSSDDLIL